MILAGNRVPLRLLKSEAIRAWRETSAEKIIFHYIQPHFPTVGSYIDLRGRVDGDEFGRNKLFARGCN